MPCIAILASNISLSFETPSRMQPAQVGTQNASSFPSSGLAQSTALGTSKPFLGRSRPYRSVHAPPTRRASVITQAQWLENSAEVEVAAPLQKCWELWEDQERIPDWMPWISSVKVSPQNPKQSTWTLQTEQFGRQWTFSWNAQLLTPVRRQKIHWRSVPGSTGGSLGGGLEVANRGQIRFYPREEDSCAIKLTISYEVPDVLAPFGGALRPVVEGILQRDMNRFSKYALSH